MLFTLSVQVPGGYKDSLSQNTPLGRAVSDACSELENIGSLVSHRHSVYVGDDRRIGFGHLLRMRKLLCHKSVIRMQETETIEKANALLAKLGYRVVVKDSANEDK